jgi:hypothetical protein
MFGPRSIVHASDHREAVGLARQQNYVSSSTAQLEHIGQLRTKDVRPGTELRLTVADSDDLFLRAHSRVPDTFATAEIFGMELVMGHEYKIARGTSVAIFSWHGCTIEMRGPTTVEYDATNQAMRDCVNLAGVIEQKRQRAEEMGTDPPRVLITGSENSGKSTLALFLSNFALRRHRRPIYVELDPGSLSTHRQLPSVPGMLSAIHLDNSAYELNNEPVHPNRINLHKNIDQGAPAPHLNPNYPIGRAINFWYGHMDWQAEKDVYWKCIAQIAAMVEMKEQLIELSAKENETSIDGRLENPSKGGVIVNCPSDPSPEIISQIVALFSINTIVVIEDEKKFMTLIDKYHGGRIPSLPTEDGDQLLKSGGPSNALIYLDAIEEGESDGTDPGIDIAHVPRADGVMTLADQHDAITHMKFADYFHGPERDLICHNFSIPLRELFISVVRVREEGETTGWTSHFAVLPFDQPLVSLRHTVLAVVLAPGLEEVILSPVAGLVWIREISDPEDPINTILHIMSPSPGPLVSNYLLAGDTQKIKYFEH